MKKSLFLLFIILLIACNKRIIPVKDRDLGVAWHPVAVGTVANDGTGDPLRTAMQQLNLTIAAAADSLAERWDTTATKTVIADSLDALRDSAIVAADYFFAQADSNDFGGAMTYNGVVNYVATNGGGSGGYEWVNFIVGTTTGSPANADTSFTIAQMAGDRIELYRGTTTDLHNQWLNETATNGITGYRYNSSGTIVVRPAWATGDRAYIRAVPSTSATKDTLAGGSSGLLASLRAVWQLNETAGTSVSDALGTYNGTTNATVNATGKSGKAESFVSASSQYASFGATVGDMGTDDFSVNFWIYVGTLQSANRGIMGSYIEGSPFFHIRMNSTNNITASINFTGSNIETTSNSALTQAAWVMVTVTWDRSGNQKMYLNGTAQTDVDDISAGVAVALDNAGTFTLGNIGGPTASWYFDGSLDEVYLYRGRLLSQSDIDELYASGAGLFYPF